MKTLHRLLALACIAVAVPLATTSCQQAPSARVVQAQTLLAAGQLADEAVATSARLYQSGAITAAQARTVMDFYTTKFQPVYRLAVTAAQSNLATYASPEIAGLAAQLLQLVATFTSKTP